MLNIQNLMLINNIIYLIIGRLLVINLIYYLFKGIISALEILTTTTSYLKPILT